MYIRTTDHFPKDTFNDDGTVTLPFLHMLVHDDIFFVEDDADLSSITYTVDDGDYQPSLNRECIKLLEATDWYDIRKSGTGKETPENITNLRNKLRALIIESSPI